MAAIDEDARARPKTPRAKTAATLLLLGICLFPAACGQPSADASKLTVVFNDGQGKVSTWDLTCAPEGGNHPDAHAACEALEKNGETALVATAPGKMCTQNIAGPQSAILSGTWRNEPVNSQFNLKDGCEIDRWNSLEGLLPRSGS